MNGIIYYTKIKDEYDNKNMEHMIGEKLLDPFRKICDVPVCRRRSGH